MPSPLRCIASARACRRWFRILPAASSPSSASVGLHHLVLLPPLRASPISKLLITGSARACRRWFRIPPHATLPSSASVDLHHLVPLSSPRASPTSKLFIISLAIVFMAHHM